MFCKKVVLKNFAKLTGKHLCQSLFLNKVAGQPATLLKIRIWRRCFPVNFAKFLRATFLQNTCRGCFWINTFYRLSVLHLHTRNRSRNSLDFSFGSICA